MSNYLTKEGFEKLKKELEYLKTVRRKEIAERLRYAASFGDLKENAAYDEAKDAQGFLEGRISELENLVRDAIVAERKARSKVEVGCCVTISQIIKNKEAEKEKFTIVGPAETDPVSGKISVESPLGKAMAGLKIGDTFDFRGPEGKIKYKVVKVE